MVRIFLLSQFIRLAGLLLAAFGVFGFDAGRDRGRFAGEGDARIGHGGAQTARLTQAGPRVCGEAGQGADEAADLRASAKAGSGFGFGSGGRLRTRIGAFEAIAQWPLGLQRAGAAWGGRSAQEPTGEAHPLGGLWLFLAGGGITPSAAFAERHRPIAMRLRLTSARRG